MSIQGSNVAIAEPALCNKLQKEFKLYKIRWFMLCLLAACYACVTFPILQFNIIANIVVDFYDVSYENVDWTAKILLILYAPCILPAMYIINKTGIRVSILITMVLICASAWIKVGSAAPDRFWVVMAGQLCVAFAQVFITALPAKFASTWFGKEETALACGIGVLGNQLGITLGCIIPIAMVRESKDKTEVAYDMSILNFGVAAICTIVLMANIACFKSKPPTPPSGAQEHLGNLDKVEFMDSTVALFKNISYVLLLVAYAISIGVFYAVPVLLNQTILQYYPNGLEEVGRIGLLMNIMGMIASTVSCYVLGKMQRFKLTTTVTFVLYFLGMVAFTLAPYHSIAMVYVSNIVMGFFMTATYSICLEVAAELSYPISESTSSGYLIAFSQAVGFGLVYFHSYLLYNYGAFWSNVGCCVEVLISTILVMCMKFERQRLKAEQVYEKSVEE